MQFIVNHDLNITAILTNLKAIVVDSNDGWSVVSKTCKRMNPVNFAIHLNNKILALAEKNAHTNIMEEDNINEGDLIAAPKLPPIEKIRFNYF